jgi:hypothetical protein
MRWLVRARLPILLFVLVAGSAGLTHAKSTDWTNDVNCPGSSITGECFTRSTSPGSSALYNECPNAGVTCVGTGNPVNQLDIGYDSLLITIVTLQKKGGGQIFSFNPSSSCASAIRMCNCDTAALMAARTINSWKRRYTTDPIPKVAACPLGPDPATHVVSQSLNGSPYVTCDDTFSGSCADAAPGDTVKLSITPLGSPTCTLFVYKNPNPPSGSGEEVTYETDPECIIANNFVKPNGGNTVKQDLLSDFIVQVKRNGINGVVTIGVQLDPGSAPVNKTITTLGTDTNDQVADKIVAAINSAPLNAAPYFLNAVKFANAAAAGSQVEALNPGTYEAGQPVVKVINVQLKVATISVKGATGASTGQEIIAENIDNGAGIPTLSEWAMILVALMLLGSGYWLFRRQRNLSTV